jgi:NADH:ubiquinone oxidoreductase subunit H
MRIGRFRNMYFRPIQDPSVLPKGKAFVRSLFMTLLASAALFLLGYKGVVPISKFSRSPIPFISGSICWVAAAFLVVFALYRIWAYFEFRYRLRRANENGKRSSL